MSDPIRLVAEFSVHEGELDAFREILKAAINATKARDAGAVGYEFFMDEEENRFYSIESYQDSEAVLAHLSNVEKIAEGLFRTCRLTRLEVFGNPSDELSAALTPSNPRFYPYWGGFRR